MLHLGNITCTAQKMKFSIKDFFSKCDQINSFLQIWSHLLKKSLMESYIFCAVSLVLIYFESRTDLEGWKLYLCQKNHHQSSKWQTKQLLQFLYIKRIGVRSALSRNMLCVIKTIGTVIKQGSRNCIDINSYPCNLLYPTCAINCAYNFLCLSGSP